MMTGTCNAVGFVSAIVGMPLLAQLEPSTAAEKLGVASAQMILAVVVVAEAWALYRMYSTWRQDIDGERQERKSEREHYEKLIADSVKSGAELAISNQQLKDAVYHFSKVVDACDKKGK